MSVQSAIETPRDATGDVLRAVGAARRRLRTVSMLRLAAIAAPAGVTLGAILALAVFALLACLWYIVPVLLRARRAARMANHVS
jgi:hypothetical protein